MNPQTALLARIVFAFALTIASVLAQRTTATLYGTALDPSAAAVPGVAVKLTSELTGAERQTTSNERGEFVFSFIAPGKYTVEARAQGFKVFSQSGLVLAAEEQVRLPITLEVGAISEQVTVTAEAALLQDAVPTLNDRVTRLQLSELPQSRRDFTQLLSLQNGIRTPGQGVFSFNGLASGGSNVTVDGVDGAGDVETPSTSLFNAFNFINVLSQEAIAEVSVSKGVFSAETGSTFGGNINVITRGGTNRFHGSLHNSQRGYVRCVVNEKVWHTDFRVVRYVSRPGAPVHTKASFVVEQRRPGAVKG